MFSDVQAWRIYQVLKQERPDLVIGHNLKGLGYYVPRLVRTLKIKYVQTIHDMQYLHPSGLLADYQRLGWGAKIYGWFCRRLLGSPDLVVFPSKFMKRIYDANGFFPRSRGAVLGNPIELRLAPQPRPEVGAVLNCLYLGQLEGYKGTVDLVEVFKELRGAATLRLVGEGSALAAAKIMAKDDERIIFYGRLDRAEIEQKIWPSIDLLINPSQVSESFGLVVLEAFAHGVPAVVSNIGALSELVIDGQTGWLIPSGDKEALSNKLQEIIDQRLITEEIKQNCLVKAKEFEVGKYLERLLNLIHNS
jgi:glycosyltransferase involved in cell wall biosynthesis